MFNVEAFNLDPGQTGYLVFSVQGGDAPQGARGTLHLGPADATGYYASDSCPSLATTRPRSTARPI